MIGSGREWRIGADAAMRGDRRKLFENGDMNLKKIPWSEVERLVYELQAYRIEIERQNKELLKTERELEESRLRYFDMFEFAPVGYLTLNRLGLILEANLTATRMLGVEHAQLINAPFSRFVRLDSQSVFYFHREDTIRNSGKQSCELKLLNGQGGVSHVHMESVRVDDDAHTIWSNIVDISERRAAEEALQEREEQLRLITDAFPVLISYVDADERYVFNNKSYELWFDRPREELKGEKLEAALGKEVYDLVYPYVNDALLGRRVTYEILLPFKHCDTRFVRATYEPHVGQDGLVKGFFSLVEDITERKQAEEDLKVALKENETLLKEIHHRVKNNLAVINSLLNLQIGRLQDEMSKDSLRDCQSRIRSMALIHETLYQSKNLAELNLKEYVGNLVNALLHTYKVAMGRVRLKIEIEEISLPPDFTVPCGLILNELISNSLKHAFPSDCEGEICITAKKTGASGVILSLRDNGVGLPEHVDIHNSGTLGLQLVKSLVERQLRGSLQVDHRNGTEFLITLDIPKASKA